MADACVVLLKDVRNGNTNTASTEKSEEQADAPEEGARGGPGTLHDDAE